jgi:SET domain-containing protein
VSAVADGRRRVDRGRIEGEEVRGLQGRVEVRRSEVHGSGLFARRRLRKGQFIGRFEGEPTTIDGTHVLWVVDEDGVERGIHGRNELRFLNHGRPPNAEFREDELFALCNVQPGAELLIDYGEGWHDTADGE